MDLLEDEAAAGAEDLICAARARGPLRRARRQDIVRVAAAAPEGSDPPEVALQAGRVHAVQEICTGLTASSPASIRSSSSGAHAAAAVEHRP